MDKLVDLSHLIEDGMTTYPGIPGPTVSTWLARSDSRTHYSEGVEFHIGRIEMVANTGTYVDVPSHRWAGGEDLADVALTSLADLPGIVIKLGPEVRAIGAEQLRSTRIEGHAVLFATGWDARWRSEAYFEEPNPHLTIEAAEWLASGGAALVGIDSVNIDDRADLTRPAHSRLLAAKIPIVEHLRGLDQLPAAGFRFFAVPPRIRDMGTFPVRAFALVGESRAEKNQAGFGGGRG